MYTHEDMRRAKRRCRRDALALAAILTPLLALYILAILHGARILMLLILALMFFAALFMGDLYLLPGIRYLRFLRTLKMGLRRSTECTLERLEGERQMQDGAWVRVLHVRVCGGGDSRIFYVNPSAVDLLPAMGAPVELTSCGRHVVEWKLR